MSLVESILIELTFALAVSLFLTVIFVVVGKRAKPRKYLILFSVILFFGSWGGGIWLSPIGPTILGVYWLSFFVVGVIFALVMEGIAAFSIRTPEEIKTADKADAKEARQIELLLRVYAWILLGILAGGIVLGYARRFHR
jgi:hypothetical protein